MTLDDIEYKLRQLGYPNIIRENGKNLSVLTDGHRVDTLEDITEKFSAKGAYYDPNKGPSSIGAVVIGEYTVRCRPANRQGIYSPGLQNELKVYEEIKSLTRTGAIRVQFTDGIRVYTYDKVIGVERVGRQTSERKKADLRLILQNGTRVPISIKQDNAEMWESADSYWASKAKRIVDSLEEEGTIEVTEKNRIFSIEPNIAIKANRAEKEAVVFGSDIQRDRGFVAIRTFQTKDFQLTSNNDVLEIRVSKLISKTAEIDDIYFLIRNDRSRKGSKIRPGIRVLAIDETRVNGGTITVRR